MGFVRCSFDEADLSAVVLCVCFRPKGLFLVHTTTTHHNHTSTHTHTITHTPSHTLSPLRSPSGCAIFAPPVPCYRNEERAILEELVEESPSAAEGEEGEDDDGGWVNTTLEGASRP